MKIKKRKRFFIVTTTGVMLFISNITTFLLLSGEYAGTSSSDVTIVHDHLSKVLQQELAQANLSVEVISNDLSNRLVVNYLVLAHRRGALVRVILNGQAQTSKATKENIRFLEENEIPVMLTEQARKLNSTMVINKRTVLMGNSLLSTGEVQDMTIIKKTKVAIQESQRFTVMWKDPTQVRLAE